MSKALTTNEVISSNKTKQQVLEELKKNDVRFIRLLFSDLNGRLKNVEVTSSQIEKVVNNEIMFDGSSIEGFTRIEESDMCLHPDLNSLRIINWEKAGTENVSIGLFFCSVHDGSGNRYPGDPRNVLIDLAESLEKQNMRALVGPEPEFFLLKENGEPNDQAGYFDLAPYDTAENCRREIMLRMEEIGFEVEAGHHEVAQGQHEIDFKYEDIVRTADNIQLFKYLVQNVAQRYGLKATFMPKPFQGINGSGMHAHFSIWQGDENLFKSEDGGLSQIAKEFVGGIMANARGLAALTNPTVNSYKRLVPGYEAPVYVAWSGSNRSCMIRVPSASGNGTRIEVRNPDPSSNPYLALSAILICGLDGMKKKTQPEPETTTNLYGINEEQRKSLGIVTLPTSLSESLDEFEANDLLCSGLGETLSAKFINEKRNEVEQYRLSVSDWERNMYL